MAGLRANWITALAGLSTALLVIAGVGMIVLGAAFWWLLIPPVIALVLLYAGIFRHGLERELRPSPSG
jgi:hypothetical protein